MQAGKLLLVYSGGWHQLRYLLFFTFFSLISCAQTEKKIADNVVPIEPHAKEAFEPIGEIVGNKEIVILGE